MCGVDSSEESGGGGGVKTNSKDGSVSSDGKAVFAVYFSSKPRLARE